MLLALHEIRWSDFAARTREGAVVGFDDVPWMPELQRKDKAGDELFDVIGVQEHAALGDKKQAVRQAVLRWHPDKFVQVPARGGRVGGGTA